ncbi:glycoside hydrolase family 16 protein [Lentithecium fluviatile CBS 122367]|uniref:chitinase n=1 Tax=Lentithecium fluviatile CBS 122367 TaxID=1168545 RepID=A0A6G1IFL1_9PLEO|nr:glycoside hydrolase family 16 protein [Lentithecium fluviatile CBS 122367]
MYSIALSAVALLAMVLPTTLAQTHTDCNPLNTTGCPDMVALGGNATFNFNETWNPDLWVKKNQGKAEWTNNGTAFTVQYRKDAPYIASSFYLFFGRVEIFMRAAPGQGIISSAILQSEDLDEIDWEFKGGNTTHVATNYYGKGNNKTVEGKPPRGIDYPMKSAPQEDFHNYTVDWTKERIQWWLNGQMLRELKYAEAEGGKEFPQTPMNIRIGAWAGGDTENNLPDTVKWAGGETNFDDGPYTMMVQTVYAQDYTSAKTYSWENMDSSGSFEKVKVVALAEGEKSDAMVEISKPHGARNRWNALSKGVQIGIIGGVVGFVVIATLLIAFCCIKQRRAGRKEYAAYQAEVNKEAADLLEHKSNWQNPRQSRYARI